MDPELSLKKVVHLYGHHQLRCEINGEAAAVALFCGKASKASIIKVSVNTKPADDAVTLEQTLRHTCVRPKQTFCFLL